MSGSILSAELGAGAVGALPSMMVCTEHLRMLKGKVQEACQQVGCPEQALHASMIVLSPSCPEMSYS